VATAGVAAPRAVAWRSAIGVGGRRQVLLLVGFVVAVVVLWEGVKFFGGVPWRQLGTGPGGPVIHNPPFRWPFANDLNLPHVWNIWLVLFQPFQRGSDVTVLQHVVGAALYTWREAAIGFGLGALIGLALATVFVHSRLVERAFVPYVIASQTIPIVALAPMIVFAFGQSVTSVVIIATYLTFFPVTIAMIRGLRSFDPRAMELMRSYAASTTQTYVKLRLPASLPYLFTALKIAATASIVGAIVGEGPGGIAEGLGRVIIVYNQYYITGPEKLWATIFLTALLGMTFFLLVRIAEILVLRARPSAATG
jgi:NitT/TauT family transport system permease protein